MAGIRAVQALCWVVGAKDRKLVRMTDARGPTWSFAGAPLVDVYPQPGSVSDQRPTWHESAQSA